MSEEKEVTRTRLSPLSLGIAIGIVWGGSIFITTFISYYTGYAKEFLEVLAVSIYPGYKITPARSFLGLIYGFIDGFIAGGLVGLIYNKLTRR
ncbi:MAG: bacteriophage holin [Nitrospirota bacterium]